MNKTGGHGSGGGATSDVMSSSKACKADATSHDRGLTQVHDPASFRFFSWEAFLEEMDAMVSAPLNLFEGANDLMDIDDKSPPQAACILPPPIPPPISDDLAAEGTQEDDGDGCRAEAGGSRGQRKSASPSTLAFPSPVRAHALTKAAIGAAATKHGEVSAAQRPHRAPTTRRQPALTAEEEQYILNEAKIRLKLSKQIERLPEPYKGKAKAICIKYEKEQSDLIERINARLFFLNAPGGGGNVGGGGGGGASGARGGPSKPPAANLQAPPSVPVPDARLSPEAAAAAAAAAASSEEWSGKSRALVHASLQKCYEHLLELKRHMANNAQKDPQVLRDWLFAHFEKPYPSADEKVALAKASGYTKKQVRACVDASMLPCFRACVLFSRELTRAMRMRIRTACDGVPSLICGGCWGRVGVQLVHQRACEAVAAHGAYIG